MDARALSVTLRRPSCRSASSQCISPTFLFALTVLLTRLAASRYPYRSTGVVIHIALQVSANKMYGAQDIGMRDEARIEHEREQMVRELSRLTAAAENPDYPALHPTFQNFLSSICRCSLERRGALQRG